MNDGKLITIIVLIVLTIWLMVIFNWITIAKRNKMVDRDDLVDVLIIFATTIVLLLLTVLPISLAMTR